MGSTEEVEALSDTGADETLDDAMGSEEAEETGRESDVEGTVEEDVIVTEAEELVPLIDGIVESVTSSLAELEALEADGLTVVAEAEAETDLELDADDGAAVEAEEARLEDELEEARLDDELEDDRLDDELELAAAEELLVVAEVNLPKIDILYHPPHFWLASPAQLVLHWLSGTISVEERVPQ